MYKSILSLAIAAGILTANGAAASGGDAVYAEYSGNTLYVIGTDANDSILVSQREGEIEINAGRVPIVGDVPFVESTWLVVMKGNGGDDRMQLVGLGMDVDAEMDGGEGNDVLMGGQGENRMWGGYGNDLLMADDVSTSGSALEGGAGNDVLIGSRGNDLMFGQDGDDLLIVNNGDGSDFLEGGEGFDFVQVNGANGAGDSFNIEPNGDRVRILSNSPETSALDIGSTEVLDVFGHGGDDVITGSAGLGDLVVELRLHGGRGRDILIGGDGNDWIDGGEDTDTCQGGGGRDVYIDCERRRR